LLLPYVFVFNVKSFLSLIGEFLSSSPRYPNSATFSLSTQWVSFLFSLLVEVSLHSVFFSPTVVTAYETPYSPLGVFSPFVRVFS